MNATDPNAVVEYFGSVLKVQQALGLKSRQTVYHWLRAKRVPELPARRIHEVTSGELPFDKAAYE